MAFDGLTDSQRQLVVTLVEELASGKYSSEFWALATFGEGWSVTLTGIGGAQGKEIGNLEETDLYAVKNEDYITLIPKRHGYVGSLKPKAYEQYKLYRQPLPPLAVPSTGEEALHTTIFDETQLARIEASSKGLLEELRQNYSLSRSQASMWFRWTLGVSVLGFILLTAGVLLVFIKQTTPAIVNSIAGILTEFLALIFFRQANSVNQHQDRYHQDLLKRQQILDAVQLARLVCQKQTRDRITETIIQQLLGINQGTEETTLTTTGT